MRWRAADMRPDSRTQGLRFAGFAITVAGVVGAILTAAYVVRTFADALGVVTAALPS
jgi:hypothetical protein